jgi:hypothetical protein
MNGQNDRQTQPSNDDCASGREQRHRAMSWKVKLCVVCVSIRVCVCVLVVLSVVRIVQVLTLPRRVATRPRYTAAYVLVLCAVCL